MLVIIRTVEIREVNFGRNVTVIKPVNLYKCSIGADSLVGPFVEIQENVTIGQRCRIQSHAFICSMVTMGDDCFISHGAKFINDPFLEGRRAHGDQSHWQPTILGNEVLIGTNATIMPVKIATGVVVGAGAVVTRDLLTKGIYAGNPARLLKKLP